MRSKRIALDSLIGQAMLILHLLLLLIAGSCARRLKREVTSEGAEVLQLVETARTLVKENPVAARRVILSIYPLSTDLS